MGDVFRLTVKKAGVDSSPEFISALEKAVDADGRPFTQFLTDADTAYRTARKRSGTSRAQVIAPGRGIAPEVRQSIEEELPLIPYEDPIAILWKKLGNEVFFDIDRETNTIVLNQNYRAAILGGRRGGLNDAPLLKSLMYLLLHKIFESERAGAKQKDDLQLWQSILVTAARSELERIGDDDD